ncbi:MAG: DUF167 domain-containing protein [Ardenticatenaceae bacterium]|nr:DUF167 domain-containing protein [Ardenticatenaceae bacterium]HBY96024.1 hypothetical protein [Chloroflexota bacterium]
MALDLRQEDDRFSFEVRVQPRASRNEVAGVYGAAVKVRLQAPPVDGRANEALIAFLAELLGIPRGDVAIVGGWTARTKRVTVRGVSPGELRRALEVE